MHISNLSTFRYVVCGLAFMRNALFCLFVWFSFVATDAQIYNRITVLKSRKDSILLRPMLRDAFTREDLSKNVDGFMYNWMVRTVRYYR